VLVFGCRSSAADYLFQQTLDEMVAAGSISKVLVAFSREPGLPKTYVQVRDGTLPAF
jgi:sulfite reductase alpha subunit-like flavoprotein